MKTAKGQQRGEVSCPCPRVRLCPRCPTDVDIIDRIGTIDRIGAIDAIDRIGTIDAIIAIGAISR